jgi:hypothetical protein
MDALAAGHDAAVQMIDTSVVRVHQHGACISDNNHQDMGPSRGGLTPCEQRGEGVHPPLPKQRANASRQIDDSWVRSLFGASLFVLILINR